MDEKMSMSMSMSMRNGVCMVGEKRFVLQDGWLAEVPLASLWEGNRTRSQACTIETKNEIEL